MYFVNTASIIVVEAFWLKTTRYLMFYLANTVPEFGWVFINICEKHVVICKPARFFEGLKKRTMDYNPEVKHLVV